MSGLVKWLKWRGVVLLAALTPPCRQIAQLASRAYERPLSPWTRFRLRMHLRICAACERYLRQLEILHQAAGSMGEKPPTAANARLAADAKDRLKRRLRCERVDS
ncbi:MAG TPA: zf-HC2 domain-containing protein [Verrucomicrobiota bacterium]|nr:hypothetical protein [Verrucomicrobiales bacterium]HRI12537.1 zf-HC2 domain-containing protein [Verrucomicrobiota bacterium]